MRNVRAGNCATSTQAPSAMTLQTNSRAGRGRRFMGFSSPTRLCEYSSLAANLTAHDRSGASRRPVPRQSRRRPRAARSPQTTSDARRVGARRAPDRVVRRHAAADDAVAVSAADRAPRDAIAVGRRRGAPHHVGAPCIGVRVEDAAADTVIAPVDVRVPGRRDPLPGR